MSEANETGSLPRESPERRGAKPPAHPGWQLSDADFPNGAVLLGRFRILRLLGSGGMGDVYEAEDLELGRVALKTVRREITGDPVLLQRFRQEVQLARRVSHANVCRVHELFTIDRGPGSLPTLFLSMEFLEGITLADKLQRDGPYRWREAEALVRQICHGLDAIHAAGVTHRDLKTRNIMLVEKNGVCRAVLTDFGLAIDSPEAAAANRETHSIAAHPAVLAGTPDYMAPEQFEGRPVSPATDIYALGIVLYELVTAHQPFASDTPETHVSPLGAAARRARRPSRLSSMHAHIPHGWDAVIDRCLEYEPAKRYGSASEVAADLHARRTWLGSWMAGAAELARRPLGWTLAAAVLACIGGGIWYWRAQHEYHHPSVEVETWYEKGVGAIREGTYVKATLSLQKATDKDPRFAMAHARLAEAWSELDFTGKAQQEMLQASTLEQEQHLPRLDTMYIHAVRDTLTHDYAGAVREYRGILGSLPEKEKADGYVDLGRALENQGKIPEALVDYQKASRLAPDSPAAFVRIGIVESGLQKKAIADKAFDNAGAIYRAEVNAEGLAEVDYQMGLAATKRGDVKEAKSCLDQSLQIAEQISSVQIEIRALTQLSSVANNSGDDQTAAAYANQAIELARDHEIEAWAARGYILLGSTYLDARDLGELDKAEAPLTEGLRIAQQTQQPRVEAFANLELASLRDRQHRPMDVIPFAQAASAYYKSHGLITNAALASTLLIRAQRDLGDLAGALRSSTELLQEAKDSGELKNLFQAEDLTASIFQRFERYPEALSHYERALELASGDSDRITEMENCAEASWHIGLYSVALRNLNAIASKKATDAFTELIEANINASQERFAQALAIARKSIARHPDMPQDLMIEFRMIQTQAELHTGARVQAVEDARQIVNELQSIGDAQDKATANLLSARVAILSGDPIGAKRSAEQAERYFQSSGQKESELISLDLVYKSQRQLKDKEGSLISVKKAVDILRDCEQSWGTPLYRSYLGRPDISSIYKDLSHE